MSSYLKKAYTNHGLIIDKYNRAAPIIADYSKKRRLTTLVSHATPQVASLNFELLLEKIKRHSESNRIRNYAMEERANVMLTFARVNADNTLPFNDWDAILGQGLVTSRTTANRIRAEQSQIETGFIAAPGELSRANYQRRTRQAKGHQSHKKAPAKPK